MYDKPVPGGHVFVFKRDTLLKHNIELTEKVYTRCKIRVTQVLRDHRKCYEKTTIIFLLRIVRNLLRTLRIDVGKPLDYNFFDSPAHFCLLLALLAMKI